MPTPDRNTLFSDISLAIEKANEHSFLSSTDSREEIEREEAIARLLALPEVAAACEKRRLDLEAREPAPSPPKPTREIPYDSRHLVRSSCDIQSGNEIGVFWAREDGKGSKGCIGKPLKKASTQDYITGVGRYGDRHSGSPLIGTATKAADLRFLKIEFEDSERRRRSAVLNGETLLLNSTAQWSEKTRRVQINLTTWDFLSGNHRNRRSHEVGIFLPKEERGKLVSLGGRSANREKNTEHANLWKSFFQARDLFAYLAKVHVALGPIPLEIRNSSPAVPAKLTAVGDELTWLPHNKKTFSDNDKVETVRVTAIRPIPTPAGLVSISPHPSIMTFNIAGLVAVGVAPKYHETWNRLIGV